MDNKINEIRRTISMLRAEMLDVEGLIRDQINGDLDCTETSVRLMAMRRQMLSLIGERDALGGRESCPNVAERLRENYRPVRKVMGKWS
jgi:2C-methyl-D-erythritol 2,4-cyclodiphosphate synthase